ncbi:rhomboid family intramembrane serine protease [Flavobacterium sp.]|uniref:rhomboid family intramembrane serine protease n=1 Tax=Flavobacterium sp. TaxID=239 RepID=UPI0039E593E8
MAIGITPSYSAMMPLNHFTAQQFMALSAEIARKLGWKIAAIDPEEIVLQTNHGRLVHNAQISIGIQDQTVHLNSVSIGNEMFDLGRNRKNVEAFQEMYYQMYRDYPLETLTEKFETLQPDLIEDEPVEAAGNSQSLYSIDFIGLFKPSRYYTVTPVLIYINTLVFIVMVAFGVSVFEPSAEVLLQWGGNLRQNTVNGQWWRLLTSCFVHSGLLHLCMNMFALAYIGALLEPKLGRVRYLSAYLLTGIFASAVSFWQHSQTVSVGASGAIFGMYGIFLALLTTNFIEKKVRNVVLPSILVFIIYNLLVGMKGNVDNAAHLGGLISGIVAGYGFVPGLIRKEKPLLQYAAIAVLATGVFLTTWIFSKTVTVQNDYALFQQKVSDFAEMENLAVEVYRHFDYSTREELMHELKNRSDYYWKENLKLVEEIDDLDLPATIHQQNDLAGEYCELYMEMNKLLYKGLNENNVDQYESQLQDYRRQIDEIANEIERISRLPQ